MADLAAYKHGRHSYSLYYIAPVLIYMVTHELRQKVYRLLLSDLIVYILLLRAFGEKAQAEIPVEGAHTFIPTVFEGIAQLP